MRRASLLVAVVLFACSKPRRQEAIVVTADPTPAPSASASVQKKSGPRGERGPFRASSAPSVHAHGDDVAFVDVGGRVARTIDGGDHWTWGALPEPFSFEVLSVGASGAAWATTDDDEASRTRILHLERDAWTDVTPKLPTTPSGDHYEPVYAFDDATAFSARCDEATPTVLSLLTTHDGGKSWGGVDVPTSFHVRSVSFVPLDARRVFALAEIDHGMGSNPALMFVTDDGGAKWTALPNPPNFGFFQLRDEKHGWLLAPEMMTAPSNLWRTDDGARTWKKVFDAMTDAPESVPEFVGDTATVIGASVHATIDGGKTWRTSKAPSDAGLTSWGPVVWYAHDDALERSLDGGATWSHVKTKMEGTVTSIEATSARTLYVVTELREGEWLVKVSHDAGETWTATTPMPRPKE